MAPQSPPHGRHFLHEPAIYLDRDGLDALVSAIWDIKGMNINGSLYMTTEPDVLTEIFAALGAKGRWCSCYIFSAQDHAAAAITKVGTSTACASKGETFPEHWWCTKQMMTVPGEDGYDQNVDDGGNTMFLDHMGNDVEEKFAEDGSLSDAAYTDNAEFECILQLLMDPIPAEMTKYSCMAAKCQGISEEIATGVAKLRDLAAKSESLSSAINANVCVTKSKFDKVYGCGYSLPDGIMRTMDAMIGGKRVLTRGRGGVSKGSALALMGAGALMLIMEVDPSNALPAYMVKGLRVVTSEFLVDEADFAILTGCMVVAYTIKDGVIKVGAKTGDICPKKARYMPPAGIWASPFARASGGLTPPGGATRWEVPAPLTHVMASCAMGNIKEGGVEFMVAQRRCHGTDYIMDEMVVGAACHRGPPLGGGARGKMPTPSTHVAASCKEGPGTTHLGVPPRRDAPVPAAIDVQLRAQRPSHSPIRLAAGDLQKGGGGHSAHPAQSLQRRPRRRAGRVFWELGWHMPPSGKA
jgi:adenosylhomocysteinase